MMILTCPPDVSSPKLFLAITPPRPRNGFRRWVTATSPTFRYPITDIWIHGTTEQQELIPSLVTRDVPLPVEVPNKAHSKSKWGIKIRDDIYYITNDVYFSQRDELSFPSVNDN
jgi:hypothetical protein